MHGAPPAYLKERLHPLFQPTRGLWLLERFNKIGAAIDAQARRRLAAPSSRERIARKDAEKAAVAVAVEQVKAIAVLDLIMPNGQRLLFCTGSDVAQWGAGFAKLAERVPSDAYVGECVTESDAAALLCAP
jgi:hypothetical protein